MNDKEMVELELSEHHRTAKAVLVSDTGEDVHAVWLPLSQIEIVSQDDNKGTLLVNCPQWLAKVKGFI